MVVSQPHARNPPLAITFFFLLQRLQQGRFTQNYTTVLVHAIVMCRHNDLTKTRSLTRTKKQTQENGYGSEGFVQEVVDWLPLKSLAYYYTTTVSTESQDKWTMLGSSSTTKATKER